MARATTTAIAVLAAGGTVNGGAMGVVVAIEVPMGRRVRAKKAADTCGAMLNVDKVRRQARKGVGIQAQMAQIVVKVQEVRAAEPINPDRPGRPMAVNPKTSRPEKQTGQFESLSLAPGPASLGPSQLGTGLLLILPAAAQS